GGRGVSGGGARGAWRGGSTPPAAVSGLHRHRIAQNVVRAAARCQSARGSQDLRAGKGRACHGLSQRLSLLPRIPARPLQRRRCLSVHGAELEHGSVPRSRALARGEGLLQPHGPASVHWKGARRGTRTRRREAGPPQGGLTEVRPRAPCPLGPAPPSGYSAFATLAGFVSATARLRVRTRERVTARFEGPRYSRQAVRTRRRGDRI